MLFRHIPITPQFLRVRSLNLPHFFLFPENMMFQARGSEARLSEAGRRKPSQLMVFNGKPPTVAGFGSGVSMPPCGFTASSHRFQHELGRTQEGTGRVWACKDHVEIAGVVQPSFYAPANGERLCLPIPSPKAKRTVTRIRSAVKFGGILFTCSNFIFRIQTRLKQSCLFTLCFSVQRNRNMNNFFLGFNGKAVTRGLLQIPFRSL